MQVNAVAILAYFKIVIIGNLRNCRSKLKTIKIEAKTWKRIKFFICGSFVTAFHTSAYMRSSSSKCMCMYIYGWHWL